MRNKGYFITGVVLLVFTIGLPGSKFSYAKEAQIHKADLSKKKPAGKIALGMTKKEVTKLWGEPVKVVPSQGTDADEIWVYPPRGKHNVQLYFKAGVLIKSSYDLQAIKKNDAEPR